jgi:regulator of nucleoside diphosphate kinase
MSRALTPNSCAAVATAFVRGLLAKRISFYTSDRRLEMAERIYISEFDHDRLHALVNQHSGSRDGTAAERLAGELDRAIVVGREELPADVVAMHSSVMFEDIRNGTVREVTLVYPSAADAAAGKLSVLAPIGAALLGLRVGDTIEWPLPNGRTAKIKILTVAQPQRAGDICSVNPSTKTGARCSREQLIENGSRFDSADVTSSQEDAMPPHAPGAPGEIRDAFDAFDTNRDGLVSIEELLTLMDQIGEALSREEAEDALRRGDTDGDGQLSFDEFIAFMLGVR